MTAPSQIFTRKARKPNLNETSKSAQVTKEMKKHDIDILDKQGKLLSTEEEQAERWVEHFREVLNCDDPSTSANPTPADEDFNIDTSPPTLHEMQKAIKSLKNNKAAGVDSINAELYKADINTASKIIHLLFTNI